ncbi:glycolate oxidase [Nemania sp. FL0916]|nr:glycolate oxidase [Nemania sp. FL0916]
MGADDKKAPIQYGEYKREIFKRGLLDGALPTITTDPNKLRQKAKKAMRLEAYDFLAGAAGEGAGMDANRLAFRQWTIIPRMMRPTAPRDLSVTLFGEKYDTPILCAPIGIQEVYHRDGEIGAAEACSELRVPYIMSTAASSTIPEVAKACGDQPRWFQLYWPMDDDITASILQTAKASGFKVLVVTVDTATMAWRPADLDRAYFPFMGGRGNAVGFSDPVFRRKFSEANNGDTPESNPFTAALAWLNEAFSGDNHPWEHFKVLRKNWDGPIVLKGILHPKDAVLALQHGVDGIIVSNHGGRNVDGVVPSLDMLPEIVAAVGDKMTILFDSGIRTGADIMKALSLGAKAVLVARPIMYGLGIGGKEGAKHVIASILADLDTTMSLAGMKRIADLTQDNLKRVSYSGSVKSNL